MNNQPTFELEDIASPSPMYHLSSTDIDSTFPNTPNHQNMMTKNHQNSIDFVANDDRKEQLEYEYDEITIEILISYGLPKTTQHYSSKGKSCPIDEYQQYIIQYFKNNRINIQQFYNSTLDKSQFVSSTIKYIEDQTRSKETVQSEPDQPLTLNPNNSSINDLPRALKQLFTIMQMSQYSNDYRGISSNSPKPTKSSTS